MFFLIGPDDLLIIEVIMVVAELKPGGGFIARRKSDLRSKRNAIQA